MRFSLKLIESNKQIQEKILQSLLPEVSDFFESGIQKLKSELSIIIRESITFTPEYDSILNGKLKYEFGLPDSSEKLTGLLDIWSTNLQYKIKKVRISNLKLVGSFSVSALKIDFSDVLYTDYAEMYDSLRGYSLPWLEWLVLSGNTTIIDDYQVFFGPSPYSRTGNAIMKPAKTSWSVPSEFSGDISNNWITRAIDNAEYQINNILNEIFK